MNSYNEPIEVEPALSLRTIALDVLERNRRHGEEERRARQKKEEDEKRQSVRAEAERAVAKVFAPEYASRAELIAHEERNDADYLTIDYEIKLEDLRFRPAYTESGGSPAGRIGLRLFDDCPACQRRHSPRTVIQDAVSLGYAVESLEEEMRNCKHGADEAELDEYYEAETPDEDVKEPATPEALGELATGEHAAALVAAEEVEAKRVGGRALKLCEKLKVTLNLFSDPQQFEGLVTFDRVKCVAARYGDLQFAMPLMGSDHPIHLIVECPAAGCEGAHTLTRETVYSRRSLGKALADGSVDAWYHHPKHTPDGEAKDDLRVRLRALLNEVLDVEE